MNQFKFGDHVKHPKHKGKLIFIESFEEVSLLKKEWAEVLSEEAGDFVFVPLEELEPASQDALEREQEARRASQLELERLKEWRNKIVLKLRRAGIKERIINNLLKD